MLYLSTNLCRNELFRDECGKNPMTLQSVWQFRGIFNISLSRAQYDTHFTERDKMIKVCDA